MKDKTELTKNVSIKNDSEIVTNCFNEKSVDKAFKEIERKLSRKYEIRRETIVNPKLNIIGIDSLEKMNDKTLEDDFNEIERMREITYLYINE